MFAIRIEPGVYVSHFDVHEKIVARTRSAAWVLYFCERSAAERWAARYSRGPYGLFKYTVIDTEREEALRDYARKIHKTDGEGVYGLAVAGRYQTEEDL